MKVCVIIDGKKNKPRKPLVKFTIGLATEQPDFQPPEHFPNPFSKGRSIMGLILKDSQQVPFTATFTTKKGNPAKIDGTPEWSVSDPAILTVASVSEDGLSAVVAAVGPVGTAQVSIKADADMGPGVREVIGTADVEVVAGEAVAAGLVGGAPIEQP